MLKRRTEIETLQVNSQRKEITGEEWNTIKEHVDTIQAALQIYLNKRALLLQSFDYWNTIEFSILRNLINSLHCGDWILYLIVIEKPNSLLFFLGKQSFINETLILATLQSTKGKVPTPLEYLHT